MVFDLHLDSAEDRIHRIINSFGGPQNDRRCNTNALAPRQHTLTMIRRTHDLDVDSLKQYLKTSEKQDQLDGGGHMSGTLLTICYLLPFVRSRRERVK